MTGAVDCRVIRSRRRRPIESKTMDAHRTVQCCRLQSGQPLNQLTLWLMKTIVNDPPKNFIEICWSIWQMKKKKKSFLQKSTVR